jgi:hypothetical protein
LLLASLGEAYCGYGTRHILPMLLPQVSLLLLGVLKLHWLRSERVSRGSSHLGVVHRGHAPQRELARLLLAWKKERLVYRHQVSI